MTVKKIPAAMFSPVPIGGTGMMFIQNPAIDPTICYALIHSQRADKSVDQKVALQASAVIDSFDYLLSSHCTMKEAVRRLRILRTARRELLKF